MGKPSPPDPPDMTAVADASMEAAQLSYDIAQQQLAWAQEVYYSDKEYYDQIIPSLVESQEFANETAAADRERYETVFQPIEDQYIQQALSYATPERMFQEAQRATTGVAQQFASAQQAATQQLEAFGVDPSATRYSALNPATQATKATSMAAAGTEAARATEAQGIAMLGDVTNLGKGYPTQSVAALNAGTQAGGTAGSTTAGATQTATNAFGMPASYINAGSGALDVGADALNQSYANEVSAYNSQMAASAGWGSALGSVLGAGLGMFSPAPTIYAQEGGAIPAEASPSGGGRPDDVVLAAEVNEFVLPRDVVEWKGLEHYYKEINSVRDKKEQMLAGAIPERSTANA